MESIMATNVLNKATPIASPPGPVEAPAVSFLSSNSTTASVNIEAKAPFSAIQALFDHLHTHPDDVAKLNATYPHRGVIKTAALHKTESDQKFTIDLSPIRNSRIPEALRESLDPHGLVGSSTSSTPSVLSMFPPYYLL
jgi:hypothetical protein